MISRMETSLGIASTAVSTCFEEICAAEVDGSGSGDEDEDGGGGGGGGNVCSTSARFDAVYSVQEQVRIRRYITKGGVDSLRGSRG